MFSLQFSRLNINIQHEFFDNYRNIGKGTKNQVFQTSLKLFGHYAIDSHTLIETDEPLNRYYYTYGIFLLLILRNSIKEIFSCI